VASGSRLRRLAFTNRARLTVLAALGVYFGTVAGLGGWYTGWQRVGVPAASFRFADLRNLTGAWECARRGVAVLPVNPCDPGRRPADFPQVWLLLWHLGLGPGDTIPVGLAQGALFLAAALLVVPRGASLKAGLVYAVALCSPAVMLGVERENPDLILFPLILAAVVLARRSARGIYGGAALVLAAAVLKLYPIFSVCFLLRRGTATALRGAFLACAGFAVYLLTDFGYLHRMLRAIPPASAFAYGVRRPAQWFGTAAEEKLGTLGSYRAWDVLLVLAAAAAAWALGRRERVAAPEGGTRELDLFWAGACIYVGSYATFLSNDYRLIFCLLTLPQLIRWARDGRALAFVTIGALLVILWLNEWTGIPGVHVVLDAWNRWTAVGSGGIPLPLVAIAQWGVFVAFGAWLLATQRLFPLRRAEFREAVGARRLSRA
jgi:hypothetical protein